MNASLSTIRQHIQHRFQHAELLEQALTHASCGPEHVHNQRLEFLGDAVLQLIITDRLYRTFPNEKEGMLANLRVHLVNGKSLAQKAQSIGIAESLRVSESQRQHHAQPSKAMLEDALEALIGALYLDGGMPAAETFIDQLYADDFQQIIPHQHFKNAKGRLQEWLQQQSPPQSLEYQFIQASGPDHNKVYTVAVLIDGKLQAKGSGASKKAAEVAAAEIALQAIEN